jgi:hypothetical protein
LGHHLDALLNASDTPGDEGELFAALLTESGPISDSRRQALLAENDQGSIGLDGQAVERAAQLVSTPIRPASPGRSSGEFRSLYAFAALKADGSVVTWGSPSYLGDINSVAQQLSSGVSQIFSNQTAFAALKADGSVVTWGNNLSGGDSSAVASQLNNVVAFANPFADDRLVDAGYTAGPTTLNGVNLGNTIMGYAVQTGDAPPLQVTYPNGDASANNPGKGWTALAAAPTTKGFALYWLNASKHQVARWHLNAKGEYQSGYYLTGNLLLNEEASLGFDLNGDGYTPGPHQHPRGESGPHSPGLCLAVGQWCSNTNQQGWFEQLREQARTRLGSRCGDVFG